VVLVVVLILTGLKEAELLIKEIAVAKVLTLKEVAVAVLVEPQEY
jgi:hypothetical protein